MSTKQERFEHAQATFRCVAPRGWREVEAQAPAQGGNSGVCTVGHEDGRKGVFRCLLADATEEMKKRFYRELEIVPQLKHKNVMRLLDYTADRDMQWYISELGIPLDTHWPRQRQQFVDDPVSLLMRAVEICEGVSAGLAAVHNRGIVHRDVKPGNIIMVSNGEHLTPSLIDFGIAYTQDDERLTRLDEAVGNARYSASPMAYRTDDVPPWFDVFELAQVLMWMMEHDRAAKHYWQRPLDWRFVRYDPALPATLRIILQSVTALCSQRETSPADGESLLRLLRNKFHSVPDNPSPDGLDERRINEIRTLAAAQKDLSKVHDIQTIAAAAPMAQAAIAPVQVGFIEMCNRASRGIPRRIGFDRSPDDFFNTLKNMAIPPEFVICRCHFGDENKTFNVQIEAIAYRPSLVEKEARFKGLPQGSNPVVFKLSRTGDHSVRLPPLFQRLIVSSTGEVIPWVEDHFSNGGQPVAPSEVLFLLRRWADDKDAWSAINS